MKVEIDGICLKEQLHELSFISSPSPPFRHSLTHTKSHSNPKCVTAAADGL